MITFYNIEQNYQTLKGYAVENLNEYIHIRVSIYEKNRLKWLANKYADGNVSLWMIYASLNMRREFIKPEDLKESKRKRVRGRKNGTHNQHGKDV